MATGSHEAQGTPAPRGVEHALARHRQKYETEIERLVEATFEVMRERDTADPTVSDILSRAGLSTSVFYRHFPTKDDLLVTLLERAHDVTASHVAERLDSVDDPRERIALWVRALFDLVRTDDLLVQNRPFLLAHPRLLQRFPDEINAGFDALAAPMQDAIAQGRDAAALSPGDPATDARLALHQIFAMLIDAAAVRTPPTRDLVDSVVSYTLRATLGASS